MHDTPLHTEPEKAVDQKSVLAEIIKKYITDVDHCKSGIAEQIDLLHNYRTGEDTPQEAKRLASIAITELQGAQMWAVKALTWKD